MPPELRERNLSRAERKFDLMAELGCDLLLVCSNVSPQSLGGIGRAADDLHALGERAAKRGMRVGFEALAWGRHISDYRDAWEAVRRADHPSIGLVLTDRTETAQILIHCGGYTAIVALVLAVLSGAIAVTYRGERLGLVRLAAVYIVVMMLDPVMKAAGRSFGAGGSGLRLDVVLFVRICAGRLRRRRWCIGFRHSRRPIKLGLLSMLLLLIAAKMTWDSAKRAGRDGNRRRFRPSYERLRMN